MISMTNVPTYDELMAAPETTYQLRRVARQIHDHAGGSIASARREAESLFLSAYQYAANRWEPSKGKFMVCVISRNLDCLVRKHLRSLDRNRLPKESMGNSRNDFNTFDVAVDEAENDSQIVITERALSGQAAHVGCL